MLLLYNDFPLFDIICILFAFYSILLLLIVLFILFISLLLLSSLLLIFLLLLLSIYLSLITHKSSQSILRILYSKTVHYFLPNTKTFLSIVSRTFSSPMWLWLRIVLQFHLRWVRVVLCYDMLCGAELCRSKLLHYSLLWILIFLVIWISVFIFIFPSTFPLRVPNTLWLVYSPLTALFRYLEVKNLFYFYFT